MALFLKPASGYLQYDTTANGSAARCTADGVPENLVT